MTTSIYTSQRVSAGPDRLGRIFHRGHMVRRLDPCWGDKTRALRAEAIDDDEGVREFVTTVIDIEELTSLDFGEAVRNADLYERVDGPESMGGRSEVRAYRDVPLKRVSRAQGQAATKKQGATKK